MTRDQIKQWAKVADLWLTSDERIAAVERFASLVAAHEREACAKVCDELTARIAPSSRMDGEFAGITDCATAIRARKEKT